jgi:polysaccharide pyruvyl transferase WcaK-like protein
MTRILLLNDNSYINNFGCQATIAAITSMLKDNFESLELRSVRQDEIAQEYQEPIRLKDTGLKSKLKTILRPKRRNQFRLVEYFPVTANGYIQHDELWLDNSRNKVREQLISQLEWADLIVHNAELLNYRHNKISYRSAYLLWLAKKLGKSAAMINQTVPAVATDLAMDGILETVCSKLDVVTVREPRSQQALAQLGITSNLVPDPVFSLKPDFSGHTRVQEWRESVNLDSKYICLSFISVSSGQAINWKTVVPQLVDLIKKIDRAGYKVVILDAGSSGLRKINQSITEQTDAVLFKGNYIDFWSLINDAAAIITGHYHNMIMAAMVGCPFIPMRSVSHKIEGVCDLLEWNEKIVNPTCLPQNADQIVSSLERISSKRLELSEKLSKKCEQLNSEATLTGTLLRAAFK